MTSAHLELPRTDGVPSLPEWLQRVLRPAAAREFRRRYDLHVHRSELVPTSGPVLLAPNHVGWLDGPVLAAMSPRVMHAMVKQEMFEGRTGWLLDRVGQIPLDRFEVDPRAVRLAVRLLRDGRVVTIYPEGSRGAGDGEFVKRGWAYLALVTGAPIVPVAVFGTRAAGRSIDWVPPRGQRMDVVFGEPIPVPGIPWPRRRDDVRSLAEQLQVRFVEHIKDAAQRCGAAMPGNAVDEEGPEPGSIGFGDSGDVAGLP